MRYFTPSSTHHGQLRSKMLYACAKQGLALTAVLYLPLQMIQMADFSLWKPAAPLTTLPSHSMHVLHPNVLNISLAIVKVERRGLGGGRALGLATATASKHEIRTGCDSGANALGKNGKVRIYTACCTGLRAAGG